MTLAPINHPDWWWAAGEIGWYVGSITIFPDQVIVSARREPNDDHYATVGIARTEDEAEMIRAMQTLLRLEGA